jgi:hypothetical protein
MIPLILCLNGSICSINDLFVNHNRFPPDYVELCTYFQKQKVDLPDYCRSTIKPKMPRLRNEF